MGRARGWAPISFISAIIPFSNAAAVPSEGFSSISSLQPGGIPGVSGGGIYGTPRGKGRGCWEKCPAKEGDSVVLY